MTKTRLSQTIGMKLFPVGLRRRVKKVVALVAVVLWCIACIGLHYVVK